MRDETDTQPVTPDPAPGLSGREATLPAPADAPAAALEAARIEREARARQERAVMAPTLCSQCLAGPTGKEFYVEQSGERGKFMLCRLRCLVLWAMYRGWPK